MLAIGVHGSGFLGTVISACLADFGTPVFCTSDDASAQMAMVQGALPFHEKNLQDLLRRNVKTGRLIYSTELEKLVPPAHTIFLAQDSAEQIEETALRIAQSMGKSAIMVVVTPVPVGTATRIQKTLKEHKLQITLVSQPVFFTDGCAVEDFNWPDRLIFGTSSEAAVKTLKTIYHPLVMRGVPVVITNYETAELVRQAATAFLATKISLINELAELCEHVGADAVSLAGALGLDKKIAPRCLQPGAGLGGPFAESDMDSLGQLATKHGVALKLLTSARDVNLGLSERLAEKVSCVLQNVSGHEIAILGLAFKPNTNSVAGSSSVRLVQNLISKGANARVHDPVAMTAARAELNGNVRYCDSPYVAAEGADALVLATAWPEFRDLDFQRIKRLLKKPIIVDTKNLLDPTQLRRIGFHYVGIGRSNPEMAKRHAAGV
jgi:UDPglucose 6-dehydrogenase